MANDRDVNASHEIELAVHDGPASWCACSCGWVSEKTADADAAAAWGAHVASTSLLTTTRAAGF